jgi:uncharacterized membrane protein
MTHLISSAAVESDRERLRQTEMDALVGYLLLGGVLLSLALIVSGLFWRYLNTGGYSLDYQLSGMNLLQIVQSEIRAVLLGQLRPRLLVSMGIAVLLLTPYLRVAASMVYFLAVLKNWKYTLFTAFVLIVLTRSLFLR